MFLLTFYMKLAIGFLVAGFVIHFIGFASPFWNLWDYSVHRSKHLGLWTVCDSTSIGTRCGSYSTTVAGIHAARAFEVLAVIGFIALLVFIILYLRRANVTMLILAIIASFVIVLLIIVGVIIWANTYKTGLHFAFAFCIIGAILTFVGGIMLIRERMTITVITSGRTTTGGAVSSRTVTTTTRVTVTR